jgi:hypothetical protein
MTLACALAYTYIVATRSAFVTGVSAENAQQGLTEYGGSPLEYRRNGRAIASVVFLWPGMVFTVVRLVKLSEILAYSVLSLIARTCYGTHSIISKPTAPNPHTRVFATR